MAQYDDDDDIYFQGKVEFFLKIHADIDFWACFCLLFFTLVIRVIIQALRLPVRAEIKSAVNYMDIATISSEYKAMLHYEYDLF